MRSWKYNAGFTLVEMLIVVAIIALLATMIVGIAARIDTQSKERALKSTFTLLDSALQEYYDYKGFFPAQPESNFTKAPVHSEYLYSELYSIPTSRKVLENISNSLIQNNFNSGVVPDAPEIYDPWKRALDYIYVPGNIFPLIVSAGPDKTFGTTDDINSR